MIRRSSAYVEQVLHGRLGDKGRGENRRAFTLVELLVVMAIIGVLASFLLPAIQAARESARKSQCANNMRNVALAVTQFETSKRHFPGYVNMLSGAKVTWLVMILPQVGRNDLYDDWRTGKTTAGPIEVFRCPSAEPDNPAPLSFVANSGRAAGPEKLANGIFVNLAGNIAAKMTTGYLDSHDGATYTLLVSENLSATSWAAAANAKATTGFVWHDTPSPIRRINGQPHGGTAASLDHARPSSAHSGGVNSAFCDGNMRFLSDELEYDVYKQLMTSYGRASDDRTNRTLFETDY